MAYNKAHNELNKMINKCVIIDDEAQVSDLANPASKELPVVSPTSSVEVVEETIALKNENSVLKHEIKNCETSIEDPNQNNFSSDDKEEDDLEEHEY